MKTYKYNVEIGEKLSKILGLVYRVNTETDYALFCDFSGHTNQIGVRLSKDKDEHCTERLGETETIYLSPWVDKDDPKSEEEGYNKINVRLNSLIDNLEKLLPVPLKIEL